LSACLRMQTHGRGLHTRPAKHQHFMVIVKHTQTAAEGSPFRQRPTISPQTAFFEMSSCNLHAAVMVPPLTFKSLT
jgi:hypothetical protein